MSCVTRVLCVGVILFLSNSSGLMFAQEKVEHTVAGKTEIPIEKDKDVRAVKQLESKRKAGGKAIKETDIDRLSFPDDTSDRYAVKSLHISGNKIISTEELLQNMPLAYNASSVGAEQAQPGDLYDLRILHEIIADPGQSREVSRRTMYGLTQYLLSAYTSAGYAGVYVYISADNVSGQAVFKDNVLAIDIVEGQVSEVTISSYDEKRNKREKGYLRSSLIEEWSPANPGEVINKKQLDDFVNLLNLNPDRYVSAVISRGSEPNSLSLGYDVYEANPWHGYVQVDNSGTGERKWAPRFGIINTNLTGRDDKFTTVYQAPYTFSFDDNYSYFASYDFPLYTPRLRLNLFGGFNEFDVSGGGGIDFLGEGSFYGGILRYNLFQTGEWFFDVTTSLKQENSKVRTLFSPLIGSDIRMNLFGVGANAYRMDDVSSTFLGFDREQNVGGSSQKNFWDPVSGTGARPDSERNFVIYTASAAHSRVLDPENQIHRISFSSKYIFPDERLAPSKLTTFGGLYSVRGYEEDEIVADGGLLLSGQYELDLTDQIEPKKSETSERSVLNKAALVFFSDYGRAKIKEPVVGENSVQELLSIGVGATFSLKNNIDAAVYYGIPLRSTDDTGRGRGLLSFNLIYRW